MEAKRSQFVLKVLPSFADFAFLMPLVILFGRLDGVSWLFTDCDTGWHIRTGEWILAHGWVPARDIFSYSRPDQPWFAWEWLSDVIWARLNALGGLQAVGLFSMLLLCATFVLVHREARRHSSAAVAFMLTMIAAAASTIHWLARPHLFTLLLVILFYGGLEAMRRGKTRLAGIPYAVLLPAGVALWTNLHGGFFVGILMIAAYGAGEWLTRRLGPADGRPVGVATPATYFAIAAACAAASLANPYTYHLHAHIVTYLRDPWQADHIAEFLSPNFHAGNMGFFEILLGLGLMAAWWNASRGRYTETILSVVWAHGALLSSRNVPIFAILAVPLSASAIQYWLRGALEWPFAGRLRAAASWACRAAARADESEATPRWRLASACGLALVIALMWAPHPPRKFQAEFNPKNYPAVALAKMNFGPSTHIFTDDEWGDYLIWRLYPRGNRVFVDGRSDFYGVEFEKKYADILHVRSGWDQTLSRFGVDTVLMPVNAPLSGALKESSRWRLVYGDDVSLVFRSNQRIAGEPTSAALSGGSSRDREVTKTETGDPITESRSKT